MSNILSPLIPIILMCCQQPLIVVRLPDGRIGITLQSLCAAINLSRASQLNRIHRNWALAEHLILIPLMTKSGLQHMDVLLMDSLSPWLAGIKVERLAPEKRPVAFALQKLAEKDILRHFAEADANQASRPTSGESAAPHATRRTRTEPTSPFELIFGGLHMLATGMERLEQDQQAVQSELASLKRQIAEMRQQPADEPNQAGPAPRAAPVLSMDHAIQLDVLAHALRSQTGEPIKAIYQALADAFGVDHVSDISDANWEAVHSWFWRRGQP